MKTKIICKLNRFLFNVIPYPKWQAHLLDKHLSQCPQCQARLLPDRQLKDFLVSPYESENLPSVLPYINKHRNYSEEYLPLNPKNEWRLPLNWQWKAALIGLVIVFVIIFLPFSPKEKPFPKNTPLTDSHLNNQVVVKSVKIDNSAVKYYFFKSKDPDKLIIWAQSHEKNGG